MENQENHSKHAFFQLSIWKIILLSFIPILVIAGYFLYINCKNFVGTNDAIIDGFTVNVSSDITGRITTLFVDEGDAVEEGQLLCQIDDTILAAQKIESEAQIVALKDTVRLQEAYYKKIEDDYFRAVKGFEDHIISAQNFDHNLKDYEMAKAKLDIAKARLEEAIAKLGVIEAQLKHTLIFAPRKGVIVKRWALSGDVLHPGQTLFSLYDLDNIWVLANLEEYKIERVRLGDAVKIHIDAYPGRTFEGKVFVIQGTAASQFSLIPQDNATGNYTKVAQRVPIKISLAPSEYQSPQGNLYLFPGMSAEIKIKVQ